MNYSFPDYGSIFKSPSFGVSSNIKVFEGGPSSFLSGAKSSSGGSNSMLGPILGFAGSLGSSIIGGISANQQAADQLRFQNAVANQQIIEGRNLGYAQIGSNIGGRVFNSTVAPIFDLKNQQFAKELELGPFAERQLGLQSEASKRERMALNSPETKEWERRQNRLAIERSLGEQLARANAAFGPVAAFGSVRSSYFG